MAVEDREDPSVGGLLDCTTQIPQLPDHHLARQAVKRLLAMPNSARLILLCAPAGFGKSTALTVLAHHAQEQGRQVAWLNLTEQNDEPAQFFGQLIESIGKLREGFGHSLQSYLTLSGELPVAALFDALLLELAQDTTPLLIVLNDLHCLNNPQLLAGLSRLVQRAPSGLCVAAASRSQPAMNLGTLRAKGLLLEVGQDELRLSEEEARDYLAQQGFALEPANFKALYQQSEGWLIALQLVALWLRNRGEGQAPLAVLNTKPGSLLDRLLSELFEQLPEHLQEALLTLGVAQQFNAELASSLLSCENAQALLDELEQRQLFLQPLDGQRQWYRFHQLFATFLRERLRTQRPERFRELNFNASLWFANHHLQGLAIEHASLADDPEMLAALVDGCALHLVNRGQLAQIYRWRQLVPDEIAQRYSTLSLVDVWTKASRMSLAEANRMVDEQLARWEQGRYEGPLSDSHMAVLAIKAVLAAQKDDLSQCIAIARKIEPYLGQQSTFLEVAILVLASLSSAMQALPEQSRRFLGLAQQRNHFLDGRYLDMQLINTEVVIALEQGQVRQARMRFDQLRAESFPAFADQPESSALVLPAICEAQLDYLQGRYEGLEQRIIWILQHIDVINPIDLYAQAMLNLARLQKMQQRSKDAQATLTNLQNMAARNQAWRFYAQALLEEVTLILQEPAVDRLKRVEARLKTVDWAKMAMPYASCEYNPVNWLQGLLRVRMQQTRGHFSEALHEINQLRQQLKANWHGLQKLRLDLLSALSYQRLGYQERAHSLLVQCLVDAEREDVRSLFIEEGESVRQLLQQLEAAERQPALQGFIRSILALWPGQAVSSESQVLEDGLTDREREVVKLAAQGHSNEEIGQQLGLALGTVKWHLHNIYEKLKVRNRTQAIRRARELGLLDS